MERQVILKFIKVIFKYRSNTYKNKKRKYQIMHNNAQKD